MRNFVILLLAGMAASCTAIPEASREMVCVTFRVDCATKSFPDVIEDTFPATIPLTITDKETGEQVAAVTGESVSLPVGAYSVLGIYHPAKSQGVQGTAVYLSKSPDIRIEQDVVVSSGTSQYSLAAGFQSWVLAVDSREVSRWTMQMDYNETDVDFMVDGTAWWVFCTGSVGDRPVQTKVYPKGDGFAPGVYDLTGSASVAAANGWSLVEPARWYWLHPVEVESGTAGLGMRFQEWSEGSLE